jgi:tripartite-type tricarboxylate transporter receptor subunit TctC
VRGWFGVLAPAGLPTEVAQKISQRIQRLVREPEVNARLVNEWAFVPAGSTPEQFAQSLLAEYAEWVEAIKTQGILLD